MSEDCRHLPGDVANGLRAGGTTGPAVRPAERGRDLRSRLLALFVAGFAAVAGGCGAASGDGDGPAAAQQATSTDLTCFFGDGLDGYNNITIDSSGYSADFESPDPATVYVTDNSGTTFGQDFWAYNSQVPLVLTLPTSPYADSYSGCSVEVGPHNDVQDWYFAEVIESSGQTQAEDEEPPADEIEADDSYADSFVNEAVSGRGSPRGFPTSVDDYRLSYEDSVTTRAFETGVRQVFDVPATMNGCAGQRFFVRWSAREDYTIEATWVYPGPPDEPVFEPAGGTAAGSAGFMISYGCTQPAFRLIEAPGPGNLTDVTVEYQVWEPAVQ